MNNTQRFSFAQTLKWSLYTLIEYFPYFFSIMITLVFIVSLLSLIALGVGFYYVGSDLVAIYKPLSKVATMKGATQNELIQLIRQQIDPQLFKKVGSQLIAFLSVFSGILFLVTRYLHLGITKITLNFYDNKSNTLETLFSCYHLIIKDVIATIIYGLLVVLGLIFFVIPGFYFMTIFTFYSKFIVDKESGPLAALQQSVALTHGQRWRIFSLLLLYWLIYFAIFSISGHLITWPFYTLIFTYVYRTLESDNL